MNDNALNELFNIMELEGDGIQSGKLVRKRELSRWIDKWIIEVESEQDVVSRSYLSPEAEDELRNALALRMLEDVVEEITIFNPENRKIKSKLVALRRQPKRV
jgi:hypothetical protein